MQPLISIIIPIYNVEQYLEQCLNSVIVDNYIDNMEVICVNDGSTDNSLAICDLFAERYNNIKLISQPNAGLSAARNTGLKNATGEYVYFLDSDDYLYPGVVQKLIEYISYNDVDTLCTNVLLDGNKHLYEMATQLFVGTRDELMSLFQKSILYPYPVQAWLWVSKRRFLLDNQLTFKEGFLHEDEDFTPRLLFYAHKVGLLNIPCQYHRVLRPGAITSTTTKKHITDTLVIARDLCDFFLRQSDINKLFLSAVFELYMSILRRINRVSFMDCFKNEIDVKNIAMLARDLKESRTSVLVKINPKLAYRYYYFELPSTIRKIINIFLFSVKCKLN